MVLLLLEVAVEVYDNFIRTASSVQLLVHEVSIDTRAAESLGIVGIHIGVVQ